MTVGREKWRELSRRRRAQFSVSVFSPFAFDHGTATSNKTETAEAAAPCTIMSELSVVATAMHVSAFEMPLHGCHITRGSLSCQCKQ